MDAIHRFTTRLFDLALAPLERFGSEWVILFVGAVFGVLALWIFKYISPQGAIGRTKNRIKGHMIEIRLYQDDLRLVTRAIGKVLWSNLRYLALNFGPFLPLAFPFALIAGQLVVRYAYDPVPVVQAEVPGEAGLAGQGVTLRVQARRADAESVAGLNLVSPGDLIPKSPLVRVPSQGMAFQEFRPASQGLHELQFSVGSHQSIKRIWAGPPEVLGSPRIALQPVRVQGWERLLWPAEAGLGDVPELQKIEFAYPERDQGWLPGKGPLSVLLWFVIASMVAGLAAIKPLRVQI